MSKEHPFNIVLVGESGVGKTSLILRLCYDKFSLQSPTLCTEYFYHELQGVYGESYHLEIVDTAGQERFRPLISNFYRRAQGAFVVFDLQNYQSFLEAKEWVRELRTRASELRMIILIGNKLDYSYSVAKCVRKDEVLAYADTYGLNYFETSARSAINVTGIFLSMARKLAQKEAEHQRFREVARLHEEAAKREDQVKLCNPPDSKKRKCCPK